MPLKPWLLSGVAFHRDHLPLVRVHALEVDFPNHVSICEHVRLVRVHVYKWRRIVFHRK